MIKKTIPLTPKNAMNLSFSIFLTTVKKDSKIAKTKTMKYSAV